MDAKYCSTPGKSVKPPGHEGELHWKQEADGLAIMCPAEMRSRRQLLSRSNDTLI